MNNSQRQTNLKLNWNYFIFFYFQYEKWNYFICIIFIFISLISGIIIYVPYLKLDNNVKRLRLRCDGMKVKKKIWYEHHLIEKRNQNALDVWLTIVALEEILSSGESISHQDAAVESRHGIPNRITIKRNQTELLTNGSTIAVYVCVWKSVVFFSIWVAQKPFSRKLCHIFLWNICILFAF